ncbi:MAG: hypothetical protein ACYTFW_00610 [Planctomycetota bacterium]|jgi:hypothetical protein
MPSGQRHYEINKDRDDPRAPQRAPGQRYKDRIDIARLYVQGYSQTYIAHWMSENRKYTLSQQTISKDIKAVLQEWRDQYLPEIDEMKAAELARIDALIQEAWQGWYKSKEVKETSETEHTEQHTKSGETSSIKPIYEESKSKLKQENRDGDYRFLQMIDKCIERRCKILGLEAPSRHEIRDWRKEAEKAGFDPAEVFENMVNEFADQDEPESNTRTS